MVLLLILGILYLGKKIPKVVGFAVLINSLTFVLKTSPDLFIDLCGSFVTNGKYPVEC